jgi:hypothetical protein
MNGTGVPNRENLPFSLFPYTELNLKLGEGNAMSKGSYFNKLSQFRVMAKTPPYQGLQLLIIIERYNIKWRSKHEELSYKFF